MAFQYPSMAAAMCESYWSGVPDGPLGAPVASDIRVAEVESYLRVGILEPLTASPRFHENCRSWLRPTPTGHRLIVHPAVTNDLVTRPSLLMPTPRDLQIALSKSKSYLAFDLRGWFYQLPLPPHLRGVFRVSYEGQVFSLGRWPMGARPSPAVADATTRWVVGLAEATNWRRTRRFAYVDDVLVLDPTEDERARLLDRIRAVGVELSDWKEGDAGRYTGTEFRLQENVFRPSASLLQKFEAAVEAATHARDARSGRRLAGYAVAVAERASLPLAVADPLHRPSSGPLSRAERNAAERLRAAAGGWRRVVDPTDVVRGASDASSSYGWGVILITREGQRFWSGRWSESARSWHINVQELYAALQAARAVAPNSRLLLETDNTTVEAWLRRGSARPRLASSLLRSIDAELAAKRSTLEVMWVPSGSNPADVPSRSTEEPPPWAPGPWTPPLPRRVLGGAVAAETPPAQGLGRRTENPGTRSVFEVFDAVEHAGDSDSTVHSWESDVAGSDSCD